MHEEHRQAAEQHELAARSHRTAAEHNAGGDRVAGKWHGERALEYSTRAYKLPSALSNSRQIGSL